MNAGDGQPAGDDPWLASFRTFSGLSPRGWLTLALLNAATQATLWYQMVGRWKVAPVSGDFGLVNCALGAVGLLSLPLVGLQFAFREFFARPQATCLDQLRTAAPVVVETAAYAWGGLCIVLLFVPLPLPSFPNFALQLLVLLNTLLALGSVVSASSFRAPDRLHAWSLYLLAAALVRLLLAGSFVAFQPWSEAALCAFLVAGVVTLLPALRPRDIDARARWRACGSMLQPDFLMFAAAAFCALGAIYLFTNADRIAALSWFDATSGPTPNAPVYVGEVGRGEVDAYQATGLLARAVLWGCLPLLWRFYSERSRLASTARATLRTFWIYLACLVAGALLLGVATRPWALGWALPFSVKYGATFAVVIVPLGLLQGLAVFALASRRYPECFLLGGSSAVYGLVLAWFGRRPDIMLPYMLGTALISLLLVLFVGVVRWGRRQP